LRAVSSAQLYHVAVLGHDHVHAQLLPYPVGQEDLSVRLTVNQDDPLEP